MTATRWRATRSGRAAGVLCAAALLLPIAVMPWRGASDLDEVERVEQRTPAVLEFPGGTEVLDEKAWARLSAGLRDRVPFRVALTKLYREAERTLLGKHRFGPVVRGEGGWLFLFESTGFRAPEPGAFERSVDALRSAAEDAGTRLVLVAAPDKSSVYPERLGAAAPRYRASLPDRESVRAVFRDRPEMVDAWAAMDRAKADAQGPIYETTGTHHNWRGAAVLAQMTIKAISPGLWDPSALRERAAGSFVLGLTRMAGFDGPEGEYVPIAVEREGVEVVAAWDREGPVEVSPRVRNGPPYYGRPVRVVTRGSAERVPGRTLFLHDSFVDSYLLDVFWPYFEDVTFIHYNNLEPGDLYGSLGRFDTVIFESVERGLWAWPGMLGPSEASAVPLDERLGVAEMPSG